MRRLALVILVAITLIPAFLRRLPPPRGRGCTSEGRGIPPRHWLGCRTDEGAPRGLLGDERLLLGLPLDPNRAAARELAFVPGLSAMLAAEVVAERERAPFRSVDDVLRVRGIGPKRLARARPLLEIEASRDVVAADGE